MKKILCAVIALFMLSCFCIPLAASECVHYANAMPPNVSGYFESLDNGLHAVCYDCDGCGKKVYVKEEAHTVGEDDKCVYCGEKVCPHGTCERVYSEHDENIHMLGYKCLYCLEVIYEEAEPHSYSNDVCVCGLQAPTAGTEEAEPPIDEGETQTPADEEFEGGEEVEYIVSQFFEEKILPFIISSGSALVMIIGALVPYIKKSGKYKRLQGIYTATKAENAKYAELLETVDFDKFKDAIETVLTTDLKRKIAELGNYEPQFEDIKTKMELLLAQMQAMKDGAMNAWAQSPAAVAALSVSPTESSVKKLIKQNTALEDYIKSVKGEEAEKIIAELKGEEYDKSGNVPAV